MGLQNACTLCHADIRWVITLGNRRWPLDVTPHEDGTVILVDVDGAVRARILNGPELPAQVEAYRQHECPKPKRPGPRCAVCVLPMDRELALLEHWTTHPCCDPRYQREKARQDQARKQVAA
jgi:hypothetical protein